MIKTRKDIKTNPPILVDRGICDNCGACIGVCPPDCMILTVKDLVIIGEECIRCGICISTCPVAALNWNDGSPNGRFLDDEDDYDEA